MLAGAERLALALTLCISVGHGDRIAPSCRVSVLFGLRRDTVRLVAPARSSATPSGDEASQLWDALQSAQDFYAAPGTH